MEFLLLGMATLVALQIIKTFAYIRHLDNKKKDKKLKRLADITVNLSEKLYWADRENRMMADILEDLVKEP